MSAATMFSGEYYLGVLANFGYTPFDLQRFDFSLAGLGADTLNSRYLCHHDAPALEAMYLLGRYVDQHDFDIAEEDNHAYYASRGIVDDTMTFRRALSLALMAADFVALGQQHDAVLVMLGVDEHRYVRFARQAVSRFDEATPLRPDFALAAAYTRMVRGFGGHPKFSKSLPGSAVDVGTPAPDVRRLLAGEPPVPEDSATYQLMCQLPIYDAPCTASSRVPAAEPSVASGGRAAGRLPARTRIVVAVLTPGSVGNRLDSMTATPATASGKAS